MGTGAGSTLQSQAKGFLSPVNRRSGHLLNLKKDIRNLIGYRLGQLHKKFGYVPCECTVQPRISKSKRCLSLQEDHLLHS